MTTIINIASIAKPPKPSKPRKLQKRQNAAEMKMLTCPPSVQWAAVSTSRELICTKKVVFFKILPICFLLFGKIIFILIMMKIQPRFLHRKGGRRDCYWGVPPIYLTLFLSQIWMHFGKTPNGLWPLPPSKLCCPIFGRLKIKNLQQNFLDRSHLPGVLIFLSCVASNNLLDPVCSSAPLQFSIWSLSSAFRTSVVFLRIEMRMTMIMAVRMTTRMRMTWAHGWWSQPTVGRIDGRSSPIIGGRNKSQRTKSQQTKYQMIFFLSNL